MLSSAMQRLTLGGGRDYGCLSSRAATAVAPRLLGAVAPFNDF